MSDDRCSFGYSEVEPKAPVPGVLYGGLQAVENLKLSQINSLWNVEGMKLPIDQEDRRLMLRVDRVVINVLLYLSHLPFQYETPELRKPRFEGKRMIPGLYPARFIGDLQMRSIPQPREPSEPTGRHLPGHWRSGHWKQQAHGAGWSKRRLIWIRPYRTNDPDPEEN